MEPKKRYSAPRVVQSVGVALERDLLVFGSIVDWIYPVETTGSEVDHVYDFSDNTFNHEWKD